MMRGLFKWETRWDKITAVAFIFAIVYILAILITQPDWKPGWATKWPDWVRDIANAILAVAITVLSIRYGGILTDFYSRLTGFGISEVREDRQGADSGSNDRWFERISGSKDIQIIGTLSRGWFVTAYGKLDDFLTVNEKTKLRILLLDPFGKVWRSKIESMQDDHKKFLHEADQVFWNLRDLISKYPARVSVQLYDSEPISCVIARGAIYLGLYLPRTSRKTIPEFTISNGSFLGSKVAEAIGKIEGRAPAVTANTLEDYRNIMLEHSNSPKEEFWDDPAVYCDFCKEPRDFPSEVSRLYPALVNGGRIAARKKHFFVVPTLGALVNDHALIVSRRHVTSSARFDSGEMTELNEIMDKLRANANGQKKAELFFEHGVPADGGTYGGCGICHCHIHSLSIPSDYNPLAGLEKFLNEKGCRFERKSLTSWDQVSQFADRSYLCVQVDKTAPAVFVFNVGERVESQLMRQFIASNCPGSREEWDWRKGGKPRPVTQTAGADAPKEMDQTEKERLKKEEEELRSATSLLSKIFA